MVYINTTGKHNEVWLDKPYAVVCSDCPSTEDAYNSGYTSGRTDGYDDGWGPGYDSGYTDGLEACSGGSCEGIWEAGYASGVTDQKNKLIFREIIKNGYYEAPDGFDAVDVNVPDRYNEGYNSGYTDGLNDCSGGSCEGVWAEGYASGVTDQKNKLMFREITKNGYYEAPDGFYAVDVNVPDRYQEGYTSGHTDGLNDCSGGSCEGVWAEGYASGVTDQKNKLIFREIIKNGYYEAPDGFEAVDVNVPDRYQEGYNSGFTDGVNSVECSGYTQEDLDAAFASGYSAGLRDCSGYTPTSGVSVLDFVYETSAANQTIRLFTGEAQNDNAYFYEFYSALTRMDIDGVQVQKSENNIYRTYPRSADWYFYTFPTAGRHTVKFYISREYNAGWTLDKLIFAYSPGYDGSHPEYPDAMPPCPIVEANIGETYEWLSQGVFQNAYELTAVTLPNSLKWVGPYSFEYSGIKEITIPDSVTQIRYESFYGTDGLFNSCSALTSATIGSGITDLKNYTFNNCTNLETVTMKSTTPPVNGNNTFNNCTSLAHIYVPAEAVEDYKAAAGWSDHASIISAIQ